MIQILQGIFLLIWAALTNEQNQHLIILKIFEKSISGVASFQRRADAKQNLKKNANLKI